MIDAPDVLYRPAADQIKAQKLTFPALQSDMVQRPASDLAAYRPASCSTSPAARRG
ncbi:MAG TPA: hypothetical protein VGB53_07500 [Rubricoccaceae bacterium]|jgi:hypothetical protein